MDSVINGKIRSKHRVDIVLRAKLSVRLQRCSSQIDFLHVKKDIGSNKGRVLQYIYKSYRQCSAFICGVYSFLSV